MAVFGPVNSIFDFMTFFVMLVVLNASHAEFRTGWFVESLATQTLVVFVIRTRRVPSYRSRPSRAMTVLPIACASIKALLPITPLAAPLGFTALLISFFAIFVGMVAAYLVLVEAVKKPFYASQQLAAPPGRSHHARHVHQNPPARPVSAIAPGPPRAQRPPHLELRASATPRSPATAPVNATWR